MIKSILVCTDGSEYGNVACDYGLFLAKQCQAELAGLHVLDSRMLEGPLMADISGWVGAQPYGAQLQQFRELLQQRGEAVAEAFGQRCRDQGIEAVAATKMGHPARAILDEEARTELLVLGQRGEHAELLEGMMGSNVERVVRHAETPCLVTPAAFHPVRRILSAYDGSGHAGKGLHEASELAAALNVELIVLTVGEPGSQRDSGRTAADGVHLAEVHGCRARPVVVEGNPEEAVLAQAHTEHCDLIVVGAYGHGRIREMFIGSTTNRLVSESDLPVMLVT
jgi:nucleotide-binding universal stress UspA family protein